MAKEKPKMDLKKALSQQLGKIYAKSGKTMAKHEKSEKGKGC